MQKQINFFEQNVQWFALGIGALFLLFMTYRYVISVPVEVTVGGKVAAPGDVDRMTLEGPDAPVAKLKQEIAKSDIPEIPQKDYVQSFVAAIKGSSDQPTMLAKYQIRSAPMIQETALVGNDATP